MSRRDADPSYRAISIVALMQIAVVTAGTLFVSVMLKARGYGSVEVPDAFFNPNSVFVRRSGFLLLLLPVAWTLSAVFIARGTGDGWATRGIFILGIGAILVGIYAYVMLGLVPTVL